MSSSAIHNLVFVLCVLLAISSQALAQENQITFDNKSGEVALVKLIGPTKREAKVPVGRTTSVEASPGTYYIKVRYGVPDRYRYSQGEEFEVTETATSRSRTTITLHKVIGGNYNTRQIEAREFNAEVKPSAGGEIYYYKPKTHIGAISRDIEITETKDGYLNIKKATDDASFAMIRNPGGNMTVVPASLGSNGIRVVVDKEVGYTTLAGLKFHQNCTINIWQNGTVEIDKEGIEATDDAGGSYVSRSIAIDSKPSIVIVRKSKTMSVNLSQIIMHPGEKKQIVLDENESVKFEFKLPKLGSCMFSLSSESPDVVTLNMGMMNALIKKGQPMVIRVTRDAKNPKPTQKFVNATGKRTTHINVELSKMLPLDK